MKPRLTGILVGLTFLGLIWSVVLRRHRYGEPATPPFLRAAVRTNLPPGYGLACDERGYMVPAFKYKNSTFPMGWVSYRSTNRQTVVDGLWKYYEWSLNEEARKAALPPEPVEPVHTYTICEEPVDTNSVQSKFGTNWVTTNSYWYTNITWTNSLTGMSFVGDSKTNWDVWMWITNITIPKVATYAGMEWNPTNVAIILYREPVIEKLTNGTWRMIFKDKQP